MKNDNFYYLAAAALMVAWLVTPAQTSAAKNHNISINFNSNAERCSDLNVRSTGELVQANETFTLQKSEAPILELDDNAGRAIVRVRAWDRPDYTVETCKFAAADTRAAAEQLLHGVSVNRTAGRFSTSGPSDNGGEWQVYFIVHAPKDANLDIQTRNGPTDVAGISGNVKIRATNGPVALRDCGGLVEAHTTNGPIAYSGQGGEVRLTAQNGPIALDLSGEVWNGPQLEAHTGNGPVALKVPATFRSGIRVETNAPVICGVAQCAGAWKDSSPNQHVIQLNGSQQTIRLSTDRGPVSIGGFGKRGRVI